MYKTRTLFFVYFNGVFVIPLTDFPFDATMLQPLINGPHTRLIALRPLAL